MELFQLIMCELKCFGKMLDKSLVTQIELVYHFIMTTIINILRCYCLVIFFITGDAIKCNRI